MPSAFCACLVYLQCFSNSSSSPIANFLRSVLRAINLSHHENRFFSVSHLLHIKENLLLRGSRASASSMKTEPFDFLVRTQRMEFCWVLQAVPALLFGIQMQNMKDQTFTKLFLILQMWGCPH